MSDAGRQNRQDRPPLCGYRPDGTLVPPGRLYMIAQMVEMNRRRAVAKCQGVHNGNLVFEAVITGMSV